MLLALACLAPAQASLTVAIPAYFYPDFPNPGSVWTEMENGFPTANLVVANPASGPGTTVDSNYVTQIAAARAAGQTVVGYVPTTYGNRAQSTVEADVDAWHALYPGIDGIFFDEGDNTCATAGYYAALQAYVKTKPGAGLVVTNPGTAVPACLANASDIIVTFEGYAANYAAWTPFGWEAQHPPAKFWHIVHSAASSEVDAILALAVQRNVGRVFVTDFAAGGNIYGGLPSYWTALLSKAAAAETETRTRTRTRTGSRTRTRTVQRFVCGQAVPAGVTSARLAAAASGPYSKNANCLWVFNNTAPGCGLTFVLGAIDSEADGDFLTVLNGPATSVVRLLHWSGTALPAVTTVQSTGSTLTVRFQGDNDLLVGTGFSATVTPYCPVPAARTTYYMGDAVPAAALNAPFTLRAVAAGVVPKMTTTTWTLTHPSTLCRPTLSLTSFSSEAEGDILTVLSGTTGLMLRWSGNGLPAVPTLTSRTNVMTVRFVTNAAVMSAGFVATVGSVCTPATFYVGDAIPANTYSSVLKVVETGNYANSLNATWTYTRTTPGCFALTFAALDTEAGADVVRVVDVATATTLVAASGTAVPGGKFKSTGTSLKVWFTSNASVTAGGFVATVLAEAC